MLYNSSTVYTLQVHDLKVEIENFKCSLHSTTRHIQEPKVLKEEIKDLYKRYLKNYDEVRDTFVERFMYINLQ